MKILGLSVDLPTCTSAVLIDDGRVIAGSPEERLNREKWSMKFPNSAISYCLDAAELQFEDIDAIAVCWNPLINVRETSSSRLTATNRHKGELMYSIPAHLMALAGNTPEYASVNISLADREIAIYFLSHHRCHAAHSFYESTFDDAVILTCDGYGENECLTVSVGEGNKVDRIATTYFPNSLGMFYGTITEYLGYRHDSDEWKVMALGAYGKTNATLFQRLRELFTVNDDLTITIDTRRFQYDNALRQGLFNQDLELFLGVPKRSRESDYLPDHYDLAKATQDVFEDVLFELCRKIRGRFDISCLCLGGGSFMNSLFNGRLAASALFEDIYIPFAPNDAGCAIGAGFHLYHDILGNSRPQPSGIASPFIGPAYTDDEVASILNGFNSRFQKLRDAPQEVAKLIAEGNLIGWFQGRMEFGERALGNRSILADPRDPSSKDRVNRAVKFREQFRPFAPSILSERAQDFFALPQRSKSGATPYMEKVFDFRKDRATLVPSVVHADGTGRIQTVTKEFNARYYDLIDAFCKLTQVPILLNTSLNRNGEPMVCSPQDALEVFYGSGLDFLVINDFLVSK